MTQQDVADRIGVSKQAVSAYETGRALPPPEKVQSLLTEAGRSIDWLLYGDDPTPDTSLISEPAPGVDAPGTTREPEIIYDADHLTDKQLHKLGLIRVPVLEAGAGPPRGNGDGDHPETLDQIVADGSWIIKSEQEIRDTYRVAPGRFIRIRIFGDSMEPTIRAGSMVDFCQWQGEPIMDRAIYYVSTPYGRMTKRLEIGQISTGHMDDDGLPVLRDVIWIRSDNPGIDDVRVAPDVFERDYKLIAWAIQTGVAL